MRLRLAVYEDSRGEVHFVNPHTHEEDSTDIGDAEGWRYLGHGYFQFEEVFSQKLKAQLQRQGELTV